MVNEAKSGTGTPPPPEVADRPQISGLEALIASASGQGEAPVDLWNPPYCGDIGLAIRADGTWTYQNSPIGRMALVKLFARVLRADPGGRHFLVTPAEKVDVAVADAPFLAVEMQVDGKGMEQVLTFRTNVDDIVVCGPEKPLRFAVTAPDGGLKPYVRVRGRLEALLTRSLYYDLAGLAVPNRQSGILEVWSSGAAFALAGPGNPDEAGAAI